MPKFRYKARPINEPHKIVTDELEAASEKEVANRLRAGGFILVNLEQVPERRLDLDLLGRWTKRVKPAQLAFFTRQLSTMISAGLTAARALEVAEENITNPTLKHAVAQIRSDISQGVALSTAMSRHPGVFSPVYVSLVRAGEEAKLPDALQRLADQTERSAQLRRDVRSAMVYPVVVLAFAFAVMFAMMLFIVPTFEGIFKASGGELPWLTQQISNASSFCRKFWFLILAGIAGGVYGLRGLLKTEWGRWQWDSLKLRIPRVNTVVQMLITARFARSMATLTEAGVTMLAALERARPTVANAVVEHVLVGVQEKVSQGVPLSVALEESGQFPDMVVAMLASGEEAGRLTEMLDTVATVYEDDVSAAIKTLKSVLEPIMIIVVGAIVAVIVIGLYLPVFKVYEQIQVQ